METLAVDGRQNAVGSPIERGQFKQLSGGKTIRLTVNYLVKRN